MAGGMHFLVGLATDDFVIIAADKANISFGAIIATDDHNKEFRLGKKLTMAVIGEQGDTDQFGEYIKANVSLYAVKNGYELAPHCAHHYIRLLIARGLRSRDDPRFVVDALIGGYDDIENKAYLGSVAYLGNSLPSQRFLFRGFSGRFCYSIMDQQYKPNLTEEEAIKLVDKCIREGKKRFVSNLPGYRLSIIDKNGYRRLPDIVF